MNPYPIKDKLKAFGLKVLTINGHSFEEMENAFKEARETKGTPTAILMATTKGKGVSFMENAVGWHGKAPNDQEYDLAMAEIRNKLEQISGGVK